MTTQSNSCCSLNRNKGHIMHYSTSMKLQVAVLVFLMSLGKGKLFFSKIYYGYPKDCLIGTNLLNIHSLLLVLRSNRPGPMPPFQII